MEKSIKILRIETGLLPEEDQSHNMIDYHVYNNIPRFYRKIEQLLRLDFYLALRAKRMEKDFDILLARSEKVGIPLSFLFPKKPMVVYGHHLESPFKAKFVKCSGITRRWSALGYLSDQAKIFYEEYYGVPSNKLFQFMSAIYLYEIVPEKYAENGPIMSVGAAKRDYVTLLLSLSELPSYRVNLFISSKYGYSLKNKIDLEIPKSVQIKGFVPEKEMINYYKNAKFVIVPLIQTTDNGAGLSAVLEAYAFGKAVIGTNVGGMPFFIKDGETGILVPPNDVDAMKNAIITLWNDPELAHRMGLAGRKYAEECFNPKIQDENISKLIRRIYENK
jgi:glycosyltransferase involved in cell wall biosynthesis